MLTNRSRKSSNASQSQSRPRVSSISERISNTFSRRSKDGWDSDAEREGELHLAREREELEGKEEEEDQDQEEEVAVGSGRRHSRTDTGDTITPLVRPLPEPAHPPAPPGGQEAPSRIPGAVAADGHVGAVEHLADTAAQLHLPPHLPLFLFAGIIAYVAARQVGLMWTAALALLGWVLREYTADDGRAAEVKEIHSDSESAEWVNAALAGLWPVLNTELFAPVIDLLEDALTQQVPPIIHSVRIDTVALGTTPLRLTSFRRLPPGEEGFLPDEKVTTTTRKRRKRGRILWRRHRLDEQATALEEGDQTAEEEEEEGVEQDVNPEGGDYVNYEVEFELVPPPSHLNGPTRQEKAHLLAYFGVGIKGVGVEIPVWVAIRRVKGIMRLRLLLDPAPPFARIGTFTLPRMPHIDISAQPIKKGFLDAMRLPGMSPYVQRSIKMVASNFISPRSYSIDLDRLLSGREGSLRTHAIGVLVVTLHAASGLRAADASGTSDPYAVISFSRFAKPLFSTRTIVKTLDPRWEETAFVPISADSIENGENLRITICDSDKWSADDVLGSIEVPLDTIVEQGERLSKARGGLPAIGEGVQRRTDALIASSHKSLPSHGSLEWSVRYCPLVATVMVPSVQDDHPAAPGPEPEPEPASTVDKLHRLVASLKPEPFAWETERLERRRETVGWLTGARAREALEAADPPNKDLHAAIVQFTIHQAENLELQTRDSTLTSHAKRRSANGKPALPSATDPAEADLVDPPSSYVEVISNDVLIYRTRTKAFDSRPYISAQAERFVRDWNHARLDFVVRDERPAEQDPVIGIVSLKLSEVLCRASQVTRWYPLAGGCGWGRLRISLLIKTVDLALEPGMRGWELGTLAIASVAAAEVDGSLFKSGKAVEVELGTDSAEHELDATRPGENGSFQFAVPKVVRLPVRYRHHGSLELEFREKRLVEKAPFALGILPLTRLEDGIHYRELRLPLWKPSEAVAAAFWPVDAEEPNPYTPVGVAVLTLAYLPGYSRAHRRIISGDKQLLRSYESWQLQTATGDRPKQQNIRGHRRGGGGSLGSLASLTLWQSGSSSSLNADEPDEAQQQAQVRSPASARFPSESSEGAQEEEDGEADASALLGDDDDGQKDKKFSPSGPKALRVFRWAKDGVGNRLAEARRVGRHGERRPVVEKETISAL